MFHETKSARPVAATPEPPQRRRRRPRIVPIAIGLALVTTFAAFGLGVTAQSRAESRIVELDERIGFLQLRLADQLAQVDILTSRAAERTAQNDDAREQLSSTEGFLE